VPASTSHSGESSEGRLTGSAAIGFAVGYKIAGTVFGVLDIFLGVLGGFGVNAGVTALRQKFQLKKLKAAYPDWKTKLG